MRGTHILEAHDCVLVIVDFQQTFLDKLDAPVLRKTFFSVARDEAILEALAAIGRCSVVLIGFDTDVCIAQSSLGLLGLQYRVAVVEDVMYAPGQAYAQGLQRMGRAGITVLLLRALYYEWMTDVVNERAFRRECSALYDEGVIDH